MKKVKRSRMVIRVLAIVLALLVLAGIALPVLSSLDIGII